MFVRLILIFFFFLIFSREFFYGDCANTLKHSSREQKYVVAMLATGYVITSNPNAVKWSSSTFSVLSHYIAIKLSMYVCTM